MDDLNDVLWMDHETLSEIDLSVRGLDNYVRHPSTRVSLTAYARGNRVVKTWEPHLNPIPDDLRDYLESPFITAMCWNATFDHAVTTRVLGVQKPISEFRDPMCQARYLSLPGSLSDVGEILGLSSETSKMAHEGKRLIKIFSEPESAGGESTLFGTSAPTFRTPETNPEDWKKFVEYCRRDVIAMRTIHKKLSKFPMPDMEWDNWLLDQKINAAGWSVDMSLVTGAQNVVRQETERLKAKLIEMTGLDNPGSVQQLLPWLCDRGYTFSSLDKTFVARAVAGECVLSEEAKEVLTIRGQTSKSSIKKYTNIADMVGEGGRLRYQYTFMGAARTGRQAAHGVNMGNLPKPVKSVEKKMDRAIELVRAGDYKTILSEFGTPLDVVASTVRASFRAPDGMKLVVADLSAIENVGAGFISRSDPVLNVFRENRDPYLDFAKHFFHQSYEELESEFMGGNKSKRTMCKPATLGAGFGLGPGKEVLDPVTGEKTWEGLLGYARALGVIMTQEEASKAITIFRSVYPEIPQTWKDLERAAKRAIKNPGTLAGVGIPHTEREKTWFEESGRKIYDTPVLSFLCHGTKVLELKLPSGRSIHYINPALTQEEYEYKGKKLTGEKISYEGKEQNKQTWGKVDTHGGKIFENADQAWARDIMFNGMQEADREGFEIIGSTYDEIITLVPENSRLTVDLLCDCMTRKPRWMPDGVPLKAAGYESKEYKKD